MRITPVLERFFSLPSDQQIDPPIAARFRRNFLVNAGDGISWLFGDSFVSIVTILPVYARTLTDSTLIIGLIPALTNAGWFLPQLFMAPYVEGLPRKLPATRLLAAVERVPFLVMSLTALWLAFLLAVFLAGTCCSILNNYLVIYLTDLGAGEGLYGLSVAAAGLSELPVYVLSPLLLRKLKPHGMLTLAFAALGLRGLAYSAIHDPRWAVGAQLLHGPTFSAMWIASVVYAGQIAPRGLGASAQSVLGAVLFGFGAGAGALLGAWLYAGLGPQTAFRTAAGLAVVGLILFGLSAFHDRQSEHAIGDADQRTD